MTKQLDTEIASDFIIALGGMISVSLEPDILPNPRPVLFTFAEAGKETGFEWSACNQGMDVIVLAFEPGRERNGPTNIAVYEERNGKVTVWPNCSPWCLPDEGRYFIASDGLEAGFLYDLTSIVMVWGLPGEHYAKRVKTAQGVLRKTAQIVSKGYSVRTIS